MINPDTSWANICHLSTLPIPHVSADFAWRMTAASGEWCESRIRGEKKRGREKGYEKRGEGRPEKRNNTMNAIMQIQYNRSNAIQLQYNNRHRISLLGCLSVWRKVIFINCFIVIHYLYISSMHMLICMYMYQHMHMYMYKYTDWYMRVFMCVSALKHACLYIYVQWNPRVDKYNKKDQIRRHHPS